MFFDLLLLHPRHRTSLSLPWRAATMGVSKIAKAIIIDADVVKLCEVLEKFIMNDSSNFKKRFSLRLSAILINGTARIYQRQVKFLEADVHQIYFSCYKTQNKLRNLENIDTPPTPKSRKITKRAKKTAIVETPDSMINALEQPLPLVLVDGMPSERIQARIDEITIREDLPRPQEQFLPEDDFGTLTIEQAQHFGLIDKPTEEAKRPRHPADSASSKSEPDVQGPRRILVEAVIEHVEPVIAPVPDAEQLIPPPLQIEQDIPRLDIEHVIPPIEIVDQAMQVEPVIQVAAPVIESVVEKAQEIQVVEQPVQEQQQIAEPIQKDADMVAPTQKGRRKSQRVLAELQIDAVSQRDQENVLKKQKKSDLWIKIRPNKGSVHRNRCPRGEGMFEDKPDENVSLNEINARHLKAKYSSIDGQPITVEGDVRAGVSVRTSVPEGSIGHLPPPITSDTPEIEMQHIATTVVQTPLTTSEQQLVSLTPGSLGLSRPRDVTVNENVATAATHQTPRKRRKIASVPEVDIPRVSIEAPSAVQDLQGIQLLPEETPSLQIDGIQDQPPIEAPVEPQASIQEVQPEVVQSVIELVEEPAPTRPLIRKERRPQDEAITEQDEKDRHQTIVNFVFAWNFDVGDLTIDDICKQVSGRINRLTIARTFGDLLTLRKLGFVSLHSHADSLELKSITKGRKLA